MAWRSIGLEPQLQTALELCSGNLTVGDGRGQGFGNGFGYGNGYGYCDGYGDGNNYGDGDGDSSK